ncbi:MAG: sugar ABC transporter substrate-binding protein [Acidimicrobiales bacterium]
MIDLHRSKGMRLVALGAIGALTLAACGGTSSPGSSASGSTAKPASSGSTSTTAGSTTAGSTTAGSATPGSAPSGSAPSGSSTTASGTAAVSTHGKHYHFELITKSNASPYWLAVKEGADAAAKKLGTVKVTFEAPPKGTDLTQQINMVNNAVTAHVDGIILAAQQPKALVGPVENAQKQGIPVITVDSGVSPNVSKSFLATSNTAAAAALAKYTAKLAGGHGQYGIVDFNQVASTGRLRPTGFKQGMASFPNFKFIGMQISNNVIAKGKSEALAMIQSHPNLNLLFGANDRAALGVAEAVQAAHKAKSIVVAGFDADLGELPLIKSGLIKASVLQSPFQMGYQGVMEMVQVKQGKSVPKRVDTPYFILTPKNIGTAKATHFIQQYVPSYKG